MFNLKTGDSLLFGDLEREIVITKAEQYLELANAIFAAKGRE